LEGEENHLFDNAVISPLPAEDNVSQGKKETQPVLKKEPEKTHKNLANVYLRRASPKKGKEFLG